MTKLVIVSARIEYLSSGSVEEFCSNLKEEVKKLLAPSGKLEGCTLSGIHLETYREQYGDSYYPCIEITGQRPQTEAEIQAEENVSKNRAEIQKRQLKILVEQFPEEAAKLIGK